MQLIGGDNIDSVVQVFEYADVRAPEPAVPLLWETIELDPQGVPIRHAHLAAPILEHELNPAELQHAAAEEAARSFEAGRLEGFEMGRTAEREALSAAHSSSLARISGELARLIEGFAAERETYLRAVEREVVRLAMAVAARILRREAQMDPLLLLGAVRVALGQLAASTQVRLRVPAADMSLWVEAVALLPDRALRPQVIPGDAMRLGDCLLETELGSVDLGVRAQLAEIERGFFDRAPAAAAEKNQSAEPAA